jgi:hypothetical protein
VEVLAAWRFLYPTTSRLCSSARNCEPVTCAKGMRVLTETTWDELGEIDVLVYPGGRDGARTALSHPTSRPWRPSPLNESTGDHRAQAHTSGAPACETRASSLRAAPTPSGARWMSE